MNGSSEANTHGVSPARRVVTRASRRKGEANFFAKLEGERYAKWLKKCWRRRQKRREERSRLKAQVLPSQESMNDWIPAQWNVLKWKDELKVGTWNVRSLLGEIPQELVCSAACRERINMLAVQECRWDGIEEGKEMGGYLWYGGGAWKNRIGARTGGVLVGVHKALGGAVMANVHKEGRVQLVKMKGMFGRNLIFGSLYVPTEIEAGGEEKRDAFWELVNEAMAEIGRKKRDVVLIGIDNNGETGKREQEELDSEAEEGEMKECMGNWGGGKSNENGRRLIEECARNGWSIASTYFNTPERKKWTFYGVFRDGDGRCRREYDQILCDEMTRRRLVRVKNVRDTLHDSDHCLRVAGVKLRGKEFRPKQKERSMTSVLRTEAAAEEVEKEVS